MIEELEDEDEVEKEEADSEEEDESFQEINEFDDGEMEEEMFSMKKRKTKSILPVDKTFSASLFLSLIHRELTFEDLKGMYVCLHVHVCMYVCKYVRTKPFCCIFTLYVYSLCLIRYFLAYFIFILVSSCLFNLQLLLSIRWSKPFERSA